MASQQHSVPAPLPCERDNSTSFRWMLHPESRDARQRPPIRILILYWSMSGHVDALALAVAGGAFAVDDVEVSLKLVPEIMSEKARRAGGNLEQAATLASIDEFPDYDSIIFSTPILSGNMCDQMCAFLNHASKLRMEGSLFSKVGSVLTATKRGGQERSMTSFRATLLHHGMIFVDVPTSRGELLNMDEITSDRSRGARTFSDGSRQPSANELDIAHFHGRYVAQMTKWLARGNA